MKCARKIICALMSLVMLFALAATAFAQDVSPESETGNATITIKNASKGETYSVYKLFDASVNGAEGGSISYTGDVPASLTNYFESNAKKNITVKDAAYADSESKTGMSDDLRAALKDWAAGATALASAESDGSVLRFIDLPYGYYVVTTTQGEQTITVTSTNPTAQIVDKNSSVPKDLTKAVDKDDINIGDTVTYTVSFKTANYSGAGEEAKRIVSYTIEDTLPTYLTDVNITSIVVDEDGDSATTEDRHDVTKQFSEKKITLSWYDDEEAKFLYKNGAIVTITYTAKVTDLAAIDGNGNTNQVTLSWKDEDGKDLPEGTKQTAEATIFTYAIALKKVNEKGEALSGAVFQLPFYVKAQPDAADKAYIYAGNEAGEGLTNTVTTPDDGLIVIKGVKTGTYSITETVAPAGYNLLTERFDVTAVKTGATSTTTTTYLDSDGNVTEKESSTKVEVNLTNLAATVKVVVNKTGAVLPSTGGVGATMFYVFGSLMVLGAAVLLVVRKRMGHTT